MAVGKRAERLDHLARLAVALEPLLGRGSLDGQPLGLARLLEHRAPFGQRRLGFDAPLACTRQRIAVAFQLDETVFPGLERCCRVGERRLRDLEPAGVLVAFVASSKMPRSSLRLARLVPRSAPLIDACRRSRSAASSRATVGQLVVAHRCGRAEERFGRDAGELGDDLVAEGRVRDVLAVVVELDGALCPAEHLLERPRLDDVVLFLLELEADHRPRVGRRVPRAQRIEVVGAARGATRDRQLDRALDGRLAGFVRAAHDGQPGREIDVEVAIAPEVLDLQPADSHSDTSCPASSSRPRRRTSRASAASSA
jgi:hypothetical protein